MAARVSDWYLTNRNTPDGSKPQVEDIRATERTFGKSWRTKIGINAFGIVRKTEDEAKEIVDKAILDVVRGSSQGQMPVMQAPSARAIWQNPPSRTSFTG